MILNDKQIIKLAEEDEMISPFVNKSVANGISHGVNPFGYDLRCGSEFKIFTNIKGATADPKNFSEDNFITVKDEESILIPPNTSWIIAGANNINGLLSTPSGAGVAIIAIPPTRINIPEIMINPPNPLDFSLIAMKNAIIGKIIAGPPSPIPLCMSSNGKNPSLFPPSPPILAATSAP